MRSRERRRVSGTRGELRGNHLWQRVTRGFRLPATIKLMTPARDFVAPHQKSISTVAVHCEQGMSRSPAVAAAIAKKAGSG